MTEITDKDPTADQVAFDGVRLAVAQQNLAAAAFQTLQVGETVETEWDPATVHDLSGGGEVDFVVRGSFLTAKANCTEISDEIPFSANVLHSKIDGVAAAKVRRSFHETLKAKLKRSDVQDDCTGSRGRYVPNPVMRTVPQRSRALEGFEEGI